MKARQTLRDFRCYVRLEWPGVITGHAVASADVPEPEVALVLAADANGHPIGNHNYWPSLLREAVAADGVCLLVPYPLPARIPTPRAADL